MPLKLELKPDERVALSACVVRNGPRRAVLLLESQCRVLRESDIVTEAQADTPCKQLLLTLSTYYLSHDPPRIEALLLDQARAIVDAMPSLAPLVADVWTALLARGGYYAIKRCRALIDAEAVILASLDSTPRPAPIRGMNRQVRSCR